MAIATSTRSRERCCGTRAEPTGGAATGILRVGDASPRNVEADDPLRGRFAAEGSAITWPGVTTHLIALAALALAAGAAYFVVRRR